MGLWASQLVGILRAVSTYKIKTHTWVCASVCVCACVMMCTLSSQNHTKPAHNNRVGKAKKKMCPQRCDPNHFHLVDCDE